MQQNPTKSYWLETLQAALPTASLPLTTEYIIIGAGISGASVAYHLSIHTNQIVVIDARGIAGGATGRNGGLFLPGTSNFKEKIERFGIETVREMIEFEHDNEAEILKYLKSNPSIDPQLHKFKHGRFSLFQNQSEYERAEIDMQSLKEHGIFEGSVLRSQHELPPQLSGYIGGLYNSRCYKVHPAKLAASLLSTAISHGAKFTPSCTAFKITGKSVSTNIGSITATKGIIICLNGYTKTLLPNLPIIPIKNQVLSSIPLSSALLDAALSIDSGFIYSSAHLSRIVTGGFRNRVDGMQSNTTDDASLHPIVSSALRGFKKPFGADSKGEMEWAGIMGFTHDGNPLVGRVERGVWICAGFSGHGMTRAFLCARELVLVLTGYKGKVRPWMDVGRVSRERCKL